MASQGSSRDSTNNKSTNSNNSNRNDKMDDHENIFVKFKHNVDNNISTVLQGVIGLPSVLRRHEKDEDNHWAQVENDRQERIDERRRAEERIAREGERERALYHKPRDSPTPAYDDEYSIPVKRYTRPSVPETSIALPTSSNSDDDYDLYSAFTPATLPKLAASTTADTSTTTTLSARTQSVAAAAQQRFSASLQDIIGANTQPLTTEKTLLPYLFFSPYSPLALHTLPKLRKADQYGFSRPATYEEAFGDLLETSLKENDKHRGHSPFSLTFSHGPTPSLGVDLLGTFGIGGLGGSKPFLFGGRQTETPDGAIEWLTSLAAKNLLRDTSLYETLDTPLGTVKAQRESATLAVLLNYLEHRGHYNSFLGGGGEGENEERTDQDMYDDFFGRVSEKALLEGPGALFRILEEAARQERQDCGEKEGSTQTSVLDTRKSHEEDKGLWGWSAIENPGEDKNVSPVAKSGTSRNQDGGKDEKGLVSHEITEESETLTDGTIKKTIITKKEFQGGKSQVTISTSFDNPGRHEERVEARYGDTSDAFEMKKDEKKGSWFWK